MAEATIKGVEAMTLQQIDTEIMNGAKFVLYQYCISIGIMTFRRSSDVYFIRKDESAFLKGIQFSIISFLLGWWGIPWGFIYTPAALYTNFKGGKDVTEPVLEHFKEALTMHMDMAEAA